MLFDIKNERINSGFRFDLRSSLLPLGKVSEFPLLSLTRRLQVSSFKNGMTGDRYVSSSIDGRGLMEEGRVVFYILFKTYS